MKNSKNTYSTSKLVMLEQPVNRDFKSHLQLTNIQRKNHYKHRMNRTAINFSD